jgi:hypothetical protein
MGIKGAHKYTHTLLSVSLKELLAIVKYRAGVHCASVIERKSAAPILDVDCSWVVRAMSHNINQEERLALLISIITEFLIVGISVVLICDGHTRHDSKRATTERQANNYRSQVDLYQKRTRLMTIGSEKISLEDGSEPRKALLAEEAQLSKSVKTLERRQQQALVDVGDNFYQRLQQYVEELDKATYEVHGATLNVIQAEFQADSVLAYRCNTGLSDMCLCSDSDIASLCGSNCFSIKKYSYKSNAKTNKVSEMFIFCPSWHDLIKVAGEVGILENLQANRFKKSIYPIFDGISDQQSRAFISVGLGCDVIPKGIDGVTPVAFFKFISENPHQKDGIAAYLWSQHAKKNKLDDNDELLKLDFFRYISVLSDVLIYEPANYLNQQLKTCPTSLYIHGDSPASLHLYIEAFARQREEILISGQSTDVLVCVGPGCGSHKFLWYENNEKCGCCKRIVCRLCTFGGKEKETIHCVDCYFSENSLTMENVTNVPTYSVMRQKLSEMGIEVRLDESMPDIIDLYEALVVSKKNDIYNNAEIMNFITQPKHGAEILDIPTTTFMHGDDILDHPTTTLTFDLKLGASFIRDDRLYLNHKIVVTCILGYLVNMDDDNMDESPMKQKDIYKVMPYYLIQIAKGARIHDGYRLLKRAMRHAMDPQTVSILQAKGSLLEYDGHTCIRIDHEVKASMKSDIYEVSVMFNMEGVVACKCTCKAGGGGKERVMCVHILPVIFQLSMLMYDGLAEHFLCELCNDWNIAFEVAVDDLNDTVKQSFKQNLLKIKQATGYDLADYESDLKRSVTELLQPYNVGTEVGKIPPPPPDPATLGPIRQLDMRSDTAKVKKKILGVAKTGGKEEVSESVQQMDYTQLNYRNIVETISSIIKKQFADESIFGTSVGYRLLLIRSGYDSFDEVVVPNNTKKLLAAAFNISNQSLRTTELDNESKTLLNIQSPKIRKRKLLFKIEEDLNESASGDDDSQSPDNHHTGYKQKKKKQRQTKRRYCSHPNCNNKTTNNPNLKMTRVPAASIKLIVNATNRGRRMFAKKNMIRKMWMERLGLLQSNDRKDLRICSDHGMINITRGFQWTIISKEVKKEKIDFLVPETEDEEQYRTRRKSSRLSNSPDADRKETGEITKDENNDDKEIEDDQVEVRRSTRFAKNKHENELDNEEKETCANEEKENSDGDDEEKEEITTRKKRGSNTYCAYVGCHVKENPENKNIRFHRVPTFHPTKVQKEKISNRDLRHDAVRKDFVSEFRKAIGQEFDEQKSMRICNKHSMFRKIKMVPWNNVQGVRQEKKVEYLLPSDIGAHSSLSQVASPSPRRNGGLARDRGLVSNLRKMQEEGDEENNNVNTFTMRLCEETFKDSGEINENVAAFVGMQQSVPRSSPGKPTYKYSETKHLEIDDDRVIVRLQNLSDKQVHRETGFKTVVGLLSFICLVCNGDVTFMVKKNSTLTWFEEWYFALERMYGRSIRRFIDAELKYGRSERTLRVLFEKKIKVILHARNTWPPFATLEEDMWLRKERWQILYRDVRAVQWDGTNTPLPTSSCADAQRKTYSAYYGGNVAKGAVGLQLCGWMRSEELWMGAVSDSEYFVRSGLLKTQTQFIEDCDATKKDHQWLNILDKGYRVTTAAWRNGKQFILQPAFAKSDRKFKGVETIRSAAVASDRGANERAVRIAKLSGYIKAGLGVNERVERYADAWLVWSFQTNFMYEPVL